jgi:hypothetical protein
MEYPRECVPKRLFTASGSFELAVAGRSGEARPLSIGPGARGPLPGSVDFLQPPPVYHFELHVAGRAHAHGTHTETRRNTRQIKRSEGLSVPQTRERIKGERLSDGSQLAEERQPPPPRECHGFIPRLSFVFSFPFFLFFGQTRTQPPPTRATRGS